MTGAQLTTRYQR